MSTVHAVDKKRRRRMEPHLARWWSGPEGRRVVGGCNGGVGSWLVAGLATYGEAGGDVGQGMGANFFHFLNLIFFILRP